MKKRYALFITLLSLAFGRISSQQVTVHPADSISQNLAAVNSFSELDEHIYLINNKSDSIEIRWSRAAQDSPPGWSFQLCDNKNCYPLPTTPKISLPVGPHDSIDLHALITPNLVVGSGWLKISAQMINDTFPPVILTYHANVTLANAIAPVSAQPNIRLFPNPANDQISIEGITPSRSVTLSVMDMQGRLLSENPVETSFFVKDISSLPAGCYLVKVMDAENNINTVRKFSKF